MNGCESTCGRLPASFVLSGGHYEGAFMKFKTVFILLTVLFFVPLCGQEEPYDKLRSEALDGNLESCFFLGNEYFYGENRKQNFTLAAHWFRKAAEGGIPEAQFNYAHCLETGRGTEKDLFAAYQWYRKAADRKFKPALYRCSRLLVTGIFSRDGKALLRPSQAEALEILEQLTAQEFEAAELDLAAYLLRRDSPLSEKARAFSILTKVTAREKYDPAALRMLADCYYGGFGCASDPDRMVQLLSRAARLGDAEAKAKLGFLYEYGRIVKEDKRKAAQLYKEAAQLGHPMGQFKYAELLSGGKPSAETMKEAMQWYQKSADQHCAQALFKLGLIYFEGIGQKMDKPLAAQYFFEAARLGYPRAQYNLATMFAEGNGLNKDLYAAFYWFMQAAQRQDPVAQRRVAVCYAEGTGVDKNLVKAQEWLIKAAQNGDVIAARMLETSRYTPW